MRAKMETKMGMKGGDMEYKIKKARALLMELGSGTEESSFVKAERFLMIQDCLKDIRKLRVGNY